MQNDSLEGYDLGQTPEAGAVTLQKPKPEDSLDGYEGGKQSDDSGLKAAMYLGAKTAPDEAAKVLDLSGKSGVPIDVTHRNISKVEESVKAGQFDTSQLSSSSPKTAAFMAQSPIHTAVVYDSIAEMQAIEASASDHDSFLHFIGNRLRSTVSSAAVGLGALPLALERAFEPGVDELKKRIERDKILMGPDSYAQRSDEELLASKLKNTPDNAFTRFGKPMQEKADREFADYVKRDKPGAIKRIAYKIAAIFPYMVTGPFSVPIMGGESFGAGSQQASEAGLGETAASTVGAAKAAVSTLFAHLIGKTFEPLSESLTKSLGQSLGNSTFKSLATDAVKLITAKTVPDVLAFTSMYAGNAVIDKTSDLNPDAYKDFASNIAEEGLTGFVLGMIGAVGPIKDITFAARSKSNLNISTMAQIGQTYAEMPVTKRSGPAAEEFLKSAFGESNKTAIMNAEEFKTLYQKRGDDPQDAANKLGVGKEYAEAEADKTEFEIPTHKLVSEYAADKEFFPKILEHIKFDADDRTAFEINEAQKESDKAEKQATSESLIEDAIKQHADSVRDQFVAAERPVAEADAAAKMEKDHVTQIMKITGMSAEDVITHLAENPLEIRGPNWKPTVKGPEPGTPEYEAAIAQEKAIAEHDTEIQNLIQQGGVTPVSSFVTKFVAGKSKVDRTPGRQLEAWNEAHPDRPFETSDDMHEAMQAESVAKTGLIAKWGGGTDAESMKRGQKIFNSMNARKETLNQLENNSSNDIISKDEVSDVAKKAKEYQEYLKSLPQTEILKKEKSESSTAVSKKEVDLKGIRLAIEKTKQFTRNQFDSLLHGIGIDFTGKFPEVDSDIKEQIEKRSGIDRRSPEQIEERKKIAESIYIITHSKLDLRKDEFGKTASHAYIYTGTEEGLSEAIQKAGGRRAKDNLRQSGMETSTGLPGMRGGDATSIRGDNSVGQEPLKQNIQGNFTRTSTGDVINLFKKADSSTAFHELSHRWFHNLAWAHEHIKGLTGELSPEQQGLQKDMDTVLKSVGATDWKSMSTEQHEKLAIWAEQYFREGKAPSAELKPVFAKLRNWFVGVYRDMSALLRGTEGINDDMRGVMDRLLASDDAIKEAETRQGGVEGDDVYGITAPAYDDAIAKAHADAVQEVADKIKAKQLSKEKADYKKELAGHVADARKELSQEKGYALLNSLISGYGPDGEKLENPPKLDRKMVILYAGESVADALPKEVFAKDAKNATDIKFLSELNGYKEPVEMLNDISGKPPIEKAAKSMAEARMDFLHGNPLTDGTMPDLADEAAHNTERKAVMRLQLDKIMENIKATKSAISALVPRFTSDANMQAGARRTISEKAVRELRPDVYLRAESKARKEAGKLFLKGDLSGSAQAKKNEISNFMLYKEAMDAKKYVERSLKYFKKFSSEGSRKNIDVGFRDQIDKLLEQHGLRKESTIERPALADFVDDTASKYGYQIAADPSLFAETQQSYRDSTYKRMVNLTQAVKSLEEAGRDKQEIMVDGKKEELATVTADAKERMNKLPQQSAETNRGLTKLNKAWLGFKSYLRSADASLLKIEQIGDWLDGKDSNGPFNTHVIRPLAEAQLAKHNMVKEVEAELKALAKLNIEDTTKQDKGKLHVADNLIDAKTGKPQELTHSELLGLAGHLRNRSNLDKVLKGEGWKEQDLRDFLNKEMSKADWDFVDGIGKTLDSVWKKKVKMMNRLNITEPEKVLPEAFETPHGKYEGGYWPITYDHAREGGIVPSADDLFEKKYVSLKTDTGRENTRVESYAKPMLLSLDSIPAVIMDEIHDTAYREAIINAHKFTSHPDIKAGVTNALGKEYHDQFLPWLKSIANDGNVNTHELKWFDSMAHGARVRMTIMGVGIRLGTSAMHGAGAALESISEVGPVWMAKGVYDFSTPTKIQENIKFVNDRSKEMPNRMQSVDRDTRDAFGDIDKKLMNPAITEVDRGLQTIRARSFQLIAISDILSAYPTWMAGYRKAMASEAEGGLGMSEEDASYYADKTVRNAHGAAGIKDLAAIQRGTEFQKLFTMFYSFWNHNYNRLRDTGRMAADSNTWHNPSDAGTVIMRTLAYTFGVQQIHHAFSGGNDKHDGEGWAHWAGRTIGGALTSGIPIVRNIYKYATGDNYGDDPFLQLTKMVGKTGKDAMGVMSGEGASDKWLKNAISSTGYIAGLPLGQPANTAQFLYDVFQGDQDPQGISDWMHGIVYGKTK